jgi:hypothetical protein
VTVEPSIAGADSPRMSSVTGDPWTSKVPGQVMVVAAGRLAVTLRQFATWAVVTTPRLRSAAY